MNIFHRPNKQMTFSGQNNISKERVNIVLQYNDIRFYYLQKIEFWRNSENITRVMVV